MVWLARFAHSKTMWFNLLIAIGAALEAVSGALQGVLPGNVYAWFTVILTVGNAILRFFTTQPLQNK